MVLLPFLCVKVCRFFIRDAMRANCLFNVSEYSGRFLFIRYAMPCFLVCFNRFLAPLHKPIIKPMLSRFCPNFFSSLLLSSNSAQTANSSDSANFCSGSPRYFHQVARTLGQAPATSARPVAGCHDIFVQIPNGCPNIKILFLKVQCSPFLNIVSNLTIRPNKKKSLAYSLFGVLTPPHVTDSTAKWMSKRQTQCLCGFCLLIMVGSKHFTFSFTTPRCGVSKSIDFKGFFAYSPIKNLP